jgi:hypothetical protein
MAEKIPQTLENHAKLDPKFHFVLVPFALANIIHTTYRCIKNPSFDSAWAAAFALFFGFAVFLIRIYSLKVQDRLIRLEERLRMQSVLPAHLQSRIGELKESQIVGLRFASDAELPGLVEAALSQSLPQKEIKQRIKTWRPDYFRV